MDVTFSKENKKAILAERLKNIKLIGVLSRLLKNPKGLIGSSILLFLVFSSLLAPVIAPFDPIELHLPDKLQGPSLTYFFGTDELGRDILSRILHGAAVSLQAGVYAVGLAAFVGVVTGLIAGYIGGTVDTIIMRFWDTILAFPGIFTAIGLVAIMGPGRNVVIYAVALTSMPTFARLVRSIAISTKEIEFVAAERALGASTWSIMFRTILPNCLTPVIINMAIAAPAAILVEASLSYLGLGSQPPEPSWGNMLQSAQAYLRQAPTYGIFPGIFITMVVFGMNMFADGLQDAIDPRRIRSSKR